MKLASDIKFESFGAFIKSLLPSCPFTSNLRTLSVPTCALYTYVLLSVPICRFLYLCNPGSLLIQTESPLFGMFTVLVCPYDRVRRCRKERQKDKAYSGSSELIRGGTTGFACFPKKAGTAAGWFCKQAGLSIVPQFHMPMRHVGDEKFALRHIIKTPFS